MPERNRKWLKVTIVALVAIAVTGVIAWIFLGTMGDNQGNHASACRKLDALCEGPGSCCDGLYCDVKSEDRKCKTCINNQSEDCLGNDYACCGGTVCGADGKCGNCIGTTNAPCGPDTARCCGGTWCSLQTKTCKNCIDKGGKCTGEKPGSCCSGLVCSTDGTCQECIRKDAQGCHTDGDCCTGLSCVQDKAGETGTCKNCTAGESEPCSATKPCCGSNKCNPDGSCTPCETGKCSADSDCCDPYVCVNGACTVCSRAGAACGTEKSLFCCPGSICMNSKCATYTKMDDFPVAILVSSLQPCAQTGVYYDTFTNETLSSYRVPKVDPETPNRRGGYYLRQAGKDKACENLLRSPSTSYSPADGVYSFHASDNDQLILSSPAEPDKDSHLENVSNGLVYWNIKRLADGYYTIYMDETNYPLSAYGGAKRGNMVRAYYYKHPIPSNYKWKFELRQDGTYNIVSADLTNATDLVIQTWGGNQPGNAIRLNHRGSYYDAPNNKWKLIPKKKQGRQDTPNALVISQGKPKLDAKIPSWSTESTPEVGTTFWYFQNGALGAETITTDAAGKLTAVRQWVKSPNGAEGEPLTMLNPGVAAEDKNMLVTETGNILYTGFGTKTMSVGKDLTWSSQATALELDVSLPPSGVPPGKPCSDSAQCAAPYGSCHNGTCSYCYQSLKRKCYTGQSLACDQRDDGSGYDWQCGSSSLVCDPGKYGDACPVPGQTKICGGNGEWGPCESVEGHQLKCKSTACDHGGCPDGCAPALPGSNNPRAVWKDGSYWQTTCGPDGRWECKSYCCDPSRDLSTTPNCEPPQGYLSCDKTEMPYCAMNKNGVMKWVCGKGAEGHDICDSIPDPPGCKDPIKFLTATACHKRCRGEMTREDWIVHDSLKVRSLTGDDGKKYDVVFDASDVLPFAPSTACDQTGVSRDDADAWKVSLMGNPRGNVETNNKFRVCKPTTDGQFCEGKCYPDADPSVDTCWYKTADHKVCPWTDAPQCEAGGIYVQDPGRSKSGICCYNGAEPDVSDGTARCKCDVPYTGNTCQGRLRHYVLQGEKASPTGQQNRRNRIGQTVKAINSSDAYILRSDNDAYRMYLTDESISVFVTPSTTCDPYRWTCELRSPVWSVHVENGVSHAIMQQDGNYCVYNTVGAGVCTLGARAGDHSGTGATYYAKLTNDGSLHVYKGLVSNWSPSLTPFSGWSLNPQHSTVTKVNRCPDGGPNYCHRAFVK